MTQRKIGVSLYCRHERSVLILLGREPHLWEPVGGEARDNETPLETARRVLVERLGCEDSEFPVIHRVTGAPPGLLLYEEHMVGDILRLNFAFIVDVPSKALQFRGDMLGMLWLSNAAEMPSEKVPVYVAEAIPYALRAGVR